MWLVCSSVNFCQLVAGSLAVRAALEPLAVRPLRVFALAGVVHRKVAVDDLHGNLIVAHQWDRSIPDGLSAVSPCFRTWRFLALCVGFAFGPISQLLRGSLWNLTSSAPYWPSLRQSGVLLDDPLMILV